MSDPATPPPAESSGPTADDPRTAAATGDGLDPIVPAWDWKIMRVLLRAVVTPAYQYRARGVEHLPDGPALFLANHQSFLDPVVVGLPLKRPISFVARDNLFDVPVLRFILHRAMTMPIRQQSAAGSLRVPIRRLQDGFFVCLFPEGERTWDGQMNPLRPGFSALLRRVDVPIVPVGIAGAHEAYARGEKLPRLSGRIRVVYGPPRRYPDLIQRGRETELLATMTEALSSVVDEAYAWRDRGDRLISGQAVSG